MSGESNTQTSTSEEPTLAYIAVKAVDSVTGRWINQGHLQFNRSAIMYLDEIRVEFIRLMETPNGGF